MTKVITPKKSLEIPAYLAQATGDEMTQAIKSLEVIDPENVRVLGFRVLLKIADKDKVSKGGIILPGSAIEKDLFSSIKATLVKVGSRAFEEEQLENRPQIGDKVHIAKYSGLPLRDKDFNMFRYTNDVDVISVEE